MNIKIKNQGYRVHVFDAKGRELENVRHADIQFTGLNDSATLQVYADDDPFLPKQQTLSGRVRACEIDIELEDARGADKLGDTRSGHFVVSAIEPTKDLGKVIGWWVDLQHSGGRERVIVTEVGMGVVGVLRGESPGSGYLYGGILLSDVKGFQRVKEATREELISAIRWIR